MRRHISTSTTPRSTTSSCPNSRPAIFKTSRRHSLPQGKPRPVSTATSWCWNKSSIRRGNGARWHGTQLGSGLVLTNEGRVLDTALLVSVVNEEAKAPLVPLGILAEGQGLTNHMGAVRAIARCESRARVRGAMRARLCSRAPSFVARVPYRWPPWQWHVCWPVRVRPLLRQSVAPQRRQVTAIRGGPHAQNPWPPPTTNHQSKLGHYPQLQR